jgi:hypothetical protein
MSLDNRYKELMQKFVTIPNSLSDEEKKYIDRVHLNNGESPLFNAVISNRIYVAYMNSKLKTTKGTLMGDYVHFPIKNKQYNTNIIKIHKNLLNNLSKDIYDETCLELKEELLWTNKNCKLTQPMYYDTHTQGSIWNGNPLPLKNLLFPQYSKNKWRGRYPLRLKFIDGDRLHWSKDNIEIITSKEYNKNKNVVILDEWTF